jgi:hypothetical protein
MFACVSQSANGFQSKVCKWFPKQGQMPSWLGVEQSQTQKRFFCNSIINFHTKNSMESLQFHKNVKKVKKVRNVALLSMVEPNSTKKQLCLQVVQIPVSPNMVALKYARLYQSFSPPKKHRSLIDGPFLLDISKDCKCSASSLALNHLWSLTVTVFAPL